MDRKGNLGKLEELSELLSDCWDIAHAYSLMGQGTPNERVIREVSRKTRMKIDEFKAWIGTRG